MLVFAAFLLTCGLVLVQGYGSGAPSGSCTSMRPGHYGTSPQTSNSPYTIETTSTTYGPGEEIPVRIRGSRAFQGLLVQARVRGTTTIVGSWSSSNLPANTRLTSCSGADNSWTHSSTGAKTDITHHWVAPSSDQGMVEFVATVLENKSTYWLNHKTGALSFSAGAGSTTSAMVTGTEGLSNNTEATATNKASPTDCTSTNCDTGKGAPTVRLSGLLLTSIAFLWKIVF